MAQTPGTTILMPFLYPCLFPATAPIRRTSSPALLRLFRPSKLHRRRQSTHVANPSLHTLTHSPAASPFEVSHANSSHLNPSPTSYSSTSHFLDATFLTLQSGSGGPGCVSFLRDVHISDGPPNGGDGGTGGNVYIQAVPGLTSLHKLARRGHIKAERGRGGMGGSKGGRRGADICIQVPVGTVVREILRVDPGAEEEVRLKELRGRRREEDNEDDEHFQAFRRDRWILYPGISRASAKELGLPSPSQLRPRRSVLAIQQAPAPITLDLDKPMATPMLLLAGAPGGLGNPHFMTKDQPKPMFASKGELGVRVKLSLELKLLADVGLVGMPNAGKSTLLRSLSRSRTRVGDWPFTTLKPSIGTVVLDDMVGRPRLILGDGEGGGAARESFTIADIPGLIEGASEDKGMGMGFLRHVERARVLAFVVDLSDGDAVETLAKLWKEVGEYEELRNAELNEESEKRIVEWSTFGGSSSISSSSSSSQLPGQGMRDLKRASKSDGLPDEQEDDEEAATETVIHPRPEERTLEPLKLPPISAKPWFIVATKADQPDTQDNFLRLRAHLDAVEAGQVPHPSGRQNSWRNSLAAIPVSAIRGEGVGAIKDWVVGLLERMR